jgi:hypothetical protein
MALRKGRPCRLPFHLVRGGSAADTSCPAVVPWSGTPRELSQDSSRGSNADPTHAPAVLGRLGWVEDEHSNLDLRPGQPDPAHSPAVLGRLGWVEDEHPNLDLRPGQPDPAHSPAVLGRLERLEDEHPNLDLRPGQPDPAPSSAVLGRLEWIKCGPGTLASRLGTANGAEGTSDQDVTRRPPRRAPCLTRHQTSDHACSIQRVGPGPAWNATSRPGWVIAAWVLA